MFSRAISYLTVLAAVLFATPTRALDISFYAMEKVLFWKQTGSNTYVAPSSNAAAFEVFAISTNQNSITNITFTPLGYSTRSLTNADGYIWRFEQYFNDSSSMDATFPSKLGQGQLNYTFSLKSTNDGVHPSTLSFSSSSSYAPIPVVTNFNWGPAQNVDHTLPFQLQWNNLNAGFSYPATSNDILSITILAGTNLAYISPTFGTSNALNGTNNFVIIPAYTFSPGITHTGHITLTHFANTPVTNYSYGVSAYTHDTQFTLKTRPAPTNLNLTFLNRTNSLVRLQFTGETNRTYTLQATTNLTAWTNLYTTNAPASGTNFTFFYTNNTTNVPQRVYRVRVGS